MKYLILFLALASCAECSQCQENAPCWVYGFKKMSREQCGSVDAMYRTYQPDHVGGSDGKLHGGAR